MDAEQPIDRVTYDVTVADVAAVHERIAPHVRRLATATVEAGALAPAPVVLALEHLQHGGSFKARGALALVDDLVRRGERDRGVVIASGGNAGIACAWAAARLGVRATVVVPTTAPRPKVDRLRALGADVRLVGAAYADAAAEAQRVVAATGAVASHAYDLPLVVAGAGTVVRELLAAHPDLDTVVVAVGGGGLFAGSVVVASEHGARVVAVEPLGCAALHAALDAGGPVDVEVDSVAADALGARRCSEAAYALARDRDVTSVVVDDAAVIAARDLLWREHRLLVEHAAATAVAALTTGAYAPTADERVGVILCGANTDPATVALGSA